MGEISSGLIEMNAHMVHSSAYFPMVFFGVACGIFFLIMAIANFKEHKTAFFVCALFACVFLAILIAAFNLPLKKEIRACANGPISLESVAAVYDIVEVDGKELVLRER